MPIGHYALSVILFVIIPTINVIVYICVLASGTDTGAMSGYMAFYAALSFLLIVWFFTSLLDVFERLKKETLNARKHYEKAAGKLEA